MGKFRIFVFYATCLGFLSAEEIPEWRTPPGWAKTKGGEGGRMIEVTTLAASGPGSLAEAISEKGARTVVFKVGGVIDLAGKPLRVSNPSITVAGETAPAPGITLIRGGMSISADDVILRHLRVRVGENGRDKKSGWEMDGISTSAAKEVIVDHCSISWATDENLSASGPRFEGKNPDEWRANTSHNITFSHCIIAEGLKNSTHAKGTHSMGSLIHDNTSGISIFGNLYISNHNRNPLFKAGARGVVVNNLIHNPGSHALTVALVFQEWEGHELQRGAVSAVGNVLRHGPSTRPAGFAKMRGPADLWFHDNLMFDAAGEALPFTLDYVGARNKPSDAGEEECVEMEKAPVWPEGMVAGPASGTVAFVLENAGARPWDRDAVDKRLIAEAKSGGGKIIDSEKEVEGYGAAGK